METYPQQQWRRVPPFCKVWKKTNCFFHAQNKYRKKHSSVPASLPAPGLGSLCSAGLLNLHSFYLSLPPSDLLSPSTSLSHVVSPPLFFLWWSGLSGRWLSVSAGSPSTVILRIVKHLGRTCSVNTHVDEWLTHSLYLCMLTLVSIFQLLLAVSL